MPQPNSASKLAKSHGPTVAKADYLSLAAMREGRQAVQRVHKKDPHGQALRTAGDMYENREFVAAYEHLKPAYDKVVTDMQRVLARNIEFEANKIAREQEKPLAAAKQQVLNTRAHAQQVIDEFNRLLQDLERKPLVRLHLKHRARVDAARTSSVEEPLPTSLSMAGETKVAAGPISSSEVVSGNRRYRKAPYAVPEKGIVYCVRDKAKGERIIKVVDNIDDQTVKVIVLRDGLPSSQPIRLTVDSLARQAAKGWCNVLLPLDEVAAAGESRPADSHADMNVMMRLDIQNFGRCCADIARAQIKFDTQLIKDVGDGPFRAGNFEQAFATFEQLAVGFSSAVASSRQAIAEGRRILTSEKGKLSGKEIQERTAAFVRREQLINTAQREFSTILEGLRMYLRAKQGDFTAGDSDD